MVTGEPTVWGKRFGLYPEADWDAGYAANLIGLLTYYEYTGNQAALDCCRKMGDLLRATFGPGKKSILSAGTHVGMAATSVLEPMCSYTATRVKRNTWKLSISSNRGTKQAARESSPRC